jgi:hypothetical protein
MVPSGSPAVQMEAIPGTVIVTEFAQVQGVDKINRVKSTTAQDNLMAAPAALRPSCFYEAI